MLPTTGKIETLAMTGEEVLSYSVEIPIWQTDVYLSYKIDIDEGIIFCRRTSTGYI